MTRVVQPTNVGQICRRDFMAGDREPRQPPPDGRIGLPVAAELYQTPRRSRFTAVGSANRAGREDCTVP
jgi:hypothetical protein